MRNTLMTAMALGPVATMLAAPEEAKADTCLLDTDNDGVVDAGTDTDGGANVSKGRFLWNRIPRLWRRVSPPSPISKEYFAHSRK